MEHRAKFARTGWGRRRERSLDRAGDPVFRENFPQFVKQIEGFPFQKIDRIYILEQVKEVKAHQDVSREDDLNLGPSTFRCPIVNDAPDRTFYLMKGSRRMEPSRTAKSIRRSPRTLSGLA